MGMDRAGGAHLPSPSLVHVPDSETEAECWRVMFSNRLAQLLVNAAAVDGHALTSALEEVLPSGENNVHVRWIGE